MKEQKSLIENIHVSKTALFSRHFSDNEFYAPSLTYSMSRVRLEKLTVSQPVKKFPAFYGTPRFITAFTSARHLSLSWARFSQSIPSHSTSWRYILILSSRLHLGLPSGLFPHQNPVYTSSLPHTCYMPRLPHFSRFYQWWVQINNP